MTVCFVCGKEGDSFGYIVPEAPEKVCDSCRFKLYKLKGNPEEPENRAKLLQLAARDNASEALKNGLSSLAGMTREEFNELYAAEMEIDKAARTMPITSGYNFEGYRIVRYGGYVSGDEVASLSSSYFMGIAQLGTGIGKDTINDAIINVRRTAIKEMKQAAAELGCNAVIGLDFDYINIDLSHSNVDVVHIILTANGTAVQIEPL